MDMVKTQHALPVARRCRLLEIPRSSAYYKPAPVPAQDAVLMRAMDEIHLELPFYGSRRMCDELAGQGHAVNRKCVQRLMRQMGLCTLYPKAHTSRAHPAHKVYPYRLRGLAIERPDQVWCADITYIPMRKGFVYLVAIMDWYSRKVLSWRLSNTLDAEFCVGALREALCTYGTPEIFNTDQGGQFTSEAFISVLKETRVTISMDGKGRWMDNVFIERLWRSLKYEEVYLHAYETIAEARDGIRRWTDFYNQRRKHQALDKRTPNTVYYETAEAEAPMGASA
jgi:putative transposase